MEYFVKFVAMTSHKYSEKLKSKISFNDDIIYILEFNNISKKNDIYTSFSGLAHVYAKSKKKAIQSVKNVFSEDITNCDIFIMSVFKKSRSY